MDQENKGGALKTSIEDKVNEWLGREGYRLEYQTYRAFEEAGFKAQLSSFIEIDGRPREIDVKATFDDDFVSMRILCECKYSQNPWIVLHGNLSHSFRECWDSLPHSSNVDQHWKFIRTCENDLKKMLHFSKDSIFGHAIRALNDKKSDNRDYAFDSLRKMTGASWECAQQERYREGNEYVIAVPCIVVEAPLVASMFEHESGKFISKTVEFARMRWTGDKFPTTVDVVQASSVKNYAKHAMQSIRKMAEAIWVADNQKKKANTIG